MLALWAFLGAILLLAWLLSFLRMLWWLKFVFRDAAAAKRAGCRVCGASAVRATWHRTGRRWSVRTVAIPWCDAHYRAAQRAMAEGPRRVS